MARLSPTSSGGSPSSRLRASGGGGGRGGGRGTSDGESDVFDEVDDTEMQLQNTITHIERLILSSRKVKGDAPGALESVSAAAAAAATGDAGNVGIGGGSGGNASGGAGGGGAVAGAREGEGETAESMAAARAWKAPPAIDRAALMTRRQSTSFFDTKPVFSARDSSGSFTKAWNGGTSTAGGGKGRGELGAWGEDGEGRQRPMTARPAHSRRQTEKWGWAASSGAEELIVGTPPTVEGSAGSSSESPSDG